MGGNDGGSSTSLQPGFRFHPTDVELVCYYLKRKVCGKSFSLDAIPEVEVYKFEPWDLPDLSKLKTGDLQWYFFCKKDGDGSRTKRTTVGGYWKATGRDRLVRYQSLVVGMTKTLVYYLGRPPRGERTDWVMHEYRLKDEKLEKSGVPQEAFVLCKISQKSGPRPKIEEQYGDPFVEEEWKDEDQIALMSNISVVTDELFSEVRDLDQPAVAKSSYFNELDNEVDEYFNVFENKVDEVDELVDVFDDLSTDMCAASFESRIEEYSLKRPASMLPFHFADSSAIGLDSWDSGGLDFDTKRLKPSHSLVISRSEIDRLAKGTLFLLSKGHEFEKDMLIQLWMAKGFIKKEPMEIIGAHYFEKLVSEGYVLCSGDNSLYKVNREKLNSDPDLIGEKPNYHIIESRNQNNTASPETWHVSVVCDDIDETMFKRLRGFNKLRTLLFLGDYGSRLQKIPRDLFLCYGSLVALDLSGTHILELPSSAVKMIHLRYLDLSWTFIELLPERIDCSRGLQTLKLKGCSRILRLPNAMERLTELRHLEIDVLGQLAAMPKGMGALVNLRTLSAFIVGTEEGFKITELKQLNNLTGELCIAKLENVQNADEAKEASLTAKRHLRNLELRWSNVEFQEPRNGDESLLQNLQPCSNLEELKVLCYGGTRLPSWIADLSFDNLVSITLFRCENVSVLPFFEKLPSLESLELISLNSVIKMGCKGATDEVVFPKLQKLSVYEMLNLETWVEAEEGDYPCLVELILKDCPKLPELPSLPYLPSIKRLEISCCAELAFLAKKELSTSLELLVVEDCPLITEKCLLEGGQDWYKIERVPNIWIDQVEIQTCEVKGKVFA